MSKVTTNHQERPVIDAWELTSDERAEFDYLNWEAIENGRESASFFRYHGQLYDLGEFMPTTTLLVWNPLCQWHGYLSDSLFSGIVVRYSSDYEYVIVGRYTT